MPSTSWLPVSSMKLRTRRGPNWLEVRLNTTMVRENTTPATVIMDPAMVESTARAPAGLPS